MRVLVGLLALLASSCCTEAVLELSEPEVSLVRTGFIAEECVLRIKNVASLQDGIYAVDFQDWSSLPQRRAPDGVHEVDGETAIELKLIQESLFQDPWKYENVVLYRDGDRFVDVAPERIADSPPPRPPSLRRRIGVSILKNPTSRIYVMILVEDLTNQRWVRLGTIDCGEGSQIPLRWLAVVPLWPFALAVDAVTGPFQAVGGCMSGSCIGPL